MFFFKLLGPEPHKIRKHGQKKLDIVIDQHCVKGTQVIFFSSCPS